MRLGEHHGGGGLGDGTACAVAELSAENAACRALDVARRSRCRSESPRAGAGRVAGRMALRRRVPPGVTCAASRRPQRKSETVTPSNPHCVRSTPSRRPSFSPAHSPLTELYEVMIPSTPSSITRRKCARNTSCRVGAIGRDVHGEPGVLHGVECVVLGDRHHVRLDAADQRRPHFAEEQRVLTVGLLYPAPGRMAGQVDAHAPEEVRPLGASFEADGGTHPLLQVAIPGRASGHGHGKCGGVSHDHPPRAVREEQPRYPETIDAAHRDRRSVVAGDVHVEEPVPERDVAVEQPELLLRRQFAEELVHQGLELLTSSETLNRQGESGLGRLIRSSIRGHPPTIGKTGGWCSAFGRMRRRRSGPRLWRSGPRPGRSPLGEAPMASFWSSV